ncbi:nitrous oxide reductase accessory protein NosL [Ideonella livida]|nr:nitrous oxide reductase accessory protein NosL [Ideonella livida]
MVSPSRRTWLRGVALGALALGGAVGLAGGGWLATGRRLPWGGTSPSAVPDEVCIVAPTFAWDPASGLPRHAARPVPETARCPVCGMFPARHPRWAAQVVFGDGAAHFLDSPVSLFLYLQDVGRYATGRQRAEIAALYVTDQDSGTWLDARQAWYLHGSTLRGPMRTADLPAFATEGGARATATRQGGVLLGFAALAATLPPELRRLGPHRHGQGVKVEG